MVNCYPKANGSYPSVNIQIYCYTTSFVLSENPPLFQTLNALLFPAWASFLASDEQCLGLRIWAWLHPLRLGLAIHGTLANWIVPHAILAPRLKQLLPFLLLGVLCATLSCQELQCGKSCSLDSMEPAGWQQGLAQQGVWSSWNEVGVVAA